MPVASNTPQPTPKKKKVAKDPARDGLTQHENRLVDDLRRAGRPT